MLHLLFKRRPRLTVLSLCCSVYRMKMFTASSEVSFRLLLHYILPPAADDGGGGRPTRNYGSTSRACTKSVTMTDEKTRTRNNIMTVSLWPSLHFTLVVAYLQCIVELFGDTTCTPERVPEIGHQISSISSTRYVISWPQTTHKASRSL